MSCTTFSAFRDRSGWRFSVEKYGPVDVSAPRTARRRLERLDRLSPHPPTLGGWLCRGLLVDDRERRLRFHSCIHERRPAIEAAWERTIRAQPAWEGWDVRFADGGANELAELLGQAVPPLPTEPTRTPWPTADWRHTRFDAQRHQLEFDVEPVELATLDEAPGLVTVVDDQRRSRHHAFAFGRDEATRAWARGPQLEELLAAAPAWPTGDEDHLGRWGILLDRPNRRLGYWGLRVTPGQAAALEAQHKGWSVQRLDNGYADQLAAAGIAPGPFCLGTGRPWPEGRLPALLERPMDRPMPSPAHDVVPCREVGVSIGWDWLGWEHRTDYRGCDSRHGQ